MSISIEYLIKLADLTKMILDRDIGKGCNDLTSEEQNVFTQEEWKEVCRWYHIQNGDPEGFERMTYYALPDFAVVGYYITISMNFILESKNITK